MTDTDKRLLLRMLHSMHKYIEQEDWLNLMILSSNMACKAIYLRQDKAIKK